ncbi:MAG TPA: trigger factor [Thermoleophilia bacterium]|nr:trigger factor [Thermoleophilia bacterium]
MKTTLSERDGNSVKLEIEVSGDELQEAFDAKLKKLVREVRIPGFRPGKAPMVMVRQRFGDEAIITDAVEDAIGGWFAAAAIELGLDPVERPQIDIGEDLPELGKSLVFTATVTVMPEVELGEYKGLEVPKESAEVKDEEVDAQVERLRNEFAELRPVTDRPVKTGDFVTADFRASLDGQPVESLEANDFVLETGAGRIFAEIEVQTLGLKPGEERTFELTLPEDFGGEGVGGKTVDFTVKVKEIKEKVLPRLSDSWTSEVSEFATLLELRQEIRGKIQGSKTFAVEQRFRGLAVQAAADNAKLDLPDVLVVEQAQEMVADFAKSLAQQGGDIKAYLEATGITVEQMIADFKPQAARNVKTGLVLDAVAKSEGLEISDGEIDHAIAQMASAARTDAAAVKASLRKNNRLEPVRWQLLRDKAADFIAAVAVAVEPPAKAAETEAAEPEATEAGPEEAVKKPKAGKRKATAETAAEAAEPVAEAVEPAAEEVAPVEGADAESSAGEDGLEST